MSTNHTQNYNLCQWEASDKVQRTDFNEDNLKTDAALAAISQVANGAKTQVQSLSNIAYTTSRTPFVVGSYSGTSVDGRIIELGFRPKFVFVFPTTFDFNMPLCFGSALDGQASKNVEIVSNGFRTHANTYGEGTNGRSTYLYFAFR